MSGSYSKKRSSHTLLIGNAAITEENMMNFLGVLEQKGLDVISEYARLMAEVGSFIVTEFHPIRSKSNLKKETKLLPIKSMISTISLPTRTL